MEVMGQVVLQALRVQMEATARLDRPAVREQAVRMGARGRPVLMGAMEHLVRPELQVRQVQVVARVLRELTVATVQVAVQDLMERPALAVQQVVMAQAGQLLRASAMQHLPVMRELPYMPLQRAKQGQLQR